MKMNRKIIVFLMTFMMILNAYAQEESEQKKEMTVSGWIGTVVVIGIVSVLTVALIGLTAFCECADLERYHID